MGGDTWRLIIMRRAGQGLRRASTGMTSAPLCDEEQEYCQSRILMCMFLTEPSETESMKAVGPVLTAQHLAARLEFTREPQN